MQSGKGWRMLIVIDKFIKNSKIRFDEKIKMNGTKNNERVGII